jgi:hypothetical protein
MVAGQPAELVQFVQQMDRYARYLPGVGLRL